MKKIFLSLIGLMFFAGTVFGAQVNRTLIAETQLDDDPTSVTGTWNIQDYKKVCFLVKYDETQMGLPVNATITMHFSYDNTNWATGGFYDIAGSTTIQTSENISSDSWYYCWLDSAWSIPYVRMTITASDTDSDDIVAVTAYLIGEK